jgi:hypothetical protein
MGGFDWQPKNPDLIRTACRCLPLLDEAIALLRRCAQTMPFADYADVCMGLDVLSLVVSGTHARA